MSIKKNLALLFFTATITMISTIAGFANVYPEAEPNDTKEAANQLTVGTQTLAEAVNGNFANEYFVKGELNSSADVDWYKISLVPSMKNYLTVNRYSGSVYNNTTFKFYSSDGSLLQTFAYTSDQVRVFHLEANTAQTYYMSVASSDWSGDFTYVMQMGNPSPVFKNVKQVFPSTTFGAGHPQWINTYNLKSDTSIPKNALCYSINLAGPSAGSVDSRYFKNESLTWNTLKLGSNQIVPTDLVKMRQLWQFKFNATKVATDRVVTPTVSLSYVYAHLPDEEMQY